MTRRCMRSVGVLAGILVAASWVACGGGGEPAAGGDDFRPPLADLAKPDPGPEDAGVEATDTWEEIEDEDRIEDQGPADPGSLCPGCFLEPCTENNQCAIGFCVETADGGKCTKKCIEATDCPGGWACRMVQNTTTDPIYVCVPTGVFLCRPCEENIDCASTVVVSQDRCVTYGAAGRFCGSACGGEKDPPCADGYDCQDVSVVGGATVKQCVPTSGQCQCSQTAIEANASTKCFVNNDNGTCFGRRECKPSGLTDCDAPIPAKEKCNNLDDDCDGVTDQDGAEGCVTFYQDNDGDTFGIGVGRCLCKDPGQGFATRSGDCNDSNSGQHPGVDENCNGLDDDCDGITDSAGAVGCRDFFLDNDGDTYGAAGADKKCLCNPVAPYSGVAMGDCDDSRSDVCLDDGKCGEKCDGVDNNCDGATDEENAKGCQPFYYDGDGDGFGLASKFRCLCGPEGKFNTTKSGDCDDTDPVVGSTGVEFCNGKDDNCNGLTDEGDAAAMCPAPPGVPLHGVAGCNGKCTLASCDGATTAPDGSYVPAWFDVNGDFQDGCECQADPAEQTGGQSCGTAIDLGTFPDSGFKMVVGGNIVPTNDEDWWVVTGSDPTWNAEANTCDLYNVRVAFTTNPGNALVVDVFRGTCAQLACSAGTFFEFATNFYDNNKGECGCSTATMPNCDAPYDGSDPTHSYQNCVAQEGVNRCGSCPGVAAPQAHACSDQSARYYIRVYHNPVMPPTCLSYQIEISNGLYQWTGQ